MKVITFVALTMLATVSIAQVGPDAYTIEASTDNTRAVTSKAHELVDVEYELRDRAKPVEVSHRIRTGKIRSMYYDNLSLKELSGMYVVRMTDTEGNYYKYK